MHLIDSIFGRSFLFLTGFFQLVERPVALHQNVEQITFTTSPDNNPIRPGDIILCNSQSPIDIIYLITKYSPIFTTVDVTTNKVYLTSRWSALFNHAGVKSGEKGSEYHGELGAVIKAASLPAPIVIFPEGTTSNGRALLSTITNLSGLSTACITHPPRIHILGIKYGVSDGGFLPTLSIPGLKPLLGFVINLCRQVHQ